jgi:prepilin-type N-terminal cleavage/methylation domain-containing protein
MRTHFLSSRSSFLGRSVRGFTLIELLVSLGIIGLVTTVVLVRYGSFDSSTILKNAAYDIALALREAQIKSISVVRADMNKDGPDFDSAYGISMTLDAAFYTAFRFASSTGHPHFDGDESELISTLELPGRTVRIVDMCTQRGAMREVCGLTRLDISFRRPEFNALVSAVEDTGTPLPNADEVTETHIFLASHENADERFVVKVTQFGQISVCKEDAPNCI